MINDDMGNQLPQTNITIDHIVMTRVIVTTILHQRVPMNIWPITNYYIYFACDNNQDEDELPQF